MAKIIKITDKLTEDRPSIEYKGKIYPVNDGMATVMKFEELSNERTTKSMMESIEVTLGKEAVEEMDIRHMSINNFKVLTIAIMAAVQGIEYDEAAARFLE